MSQPSQACSSQVCRCAGSCCRDLAFMCMGEPFICVERGVASDCQSVATLLRPRQHQIKLQQRLGGVVLLRICEIQSILEDSAWVLAEAMNGRVFLLTPALWVVSFFSRLQIQKVAHHFRDGLRLAGLRPGLRASASALVWLYQEWLSSPREAFRANESGFPSHFPFWNLQKWQLINFGFGDIQCFFFG